MNSKSTDDRIREIAEGIYHNRLTSADVADMDGMAKKVIAKSLERAKNYTLKDTDEAARFAEKAADGLARMHAAAACASMHPDMRADVLEKLAKKCEVTLVEVLAVDHYLNGGTTDKDTAKKADYEAADKLLAETHGYVRNLSMGSTDMAEVMELGGPADSAAESLAYMHGTFKHVIENPDTSEKDRETLKAMNVKVRDMIAELVALCQNRYSTRTFDKSTENEYKGTPHDTMHAEEVVEGLLDAANDRASEFPITSHDEALPALVRAVSHMTAISTFLLEMCANDDEKRTELMECSNSASSAAIETLRVMNYLSEEMVK